MRSARRFPNARSFLIAARSVPIESFAFRYAPAAAVKADARATVGAVVSEKRSIREMCADLGVYPGLAARLLGGLQKEQNRLALTDHTAESVRCRSLRLGGYKKDP